MKVTHNFFLVGLNIIAEVQVMKELLFGLRLIMPTDVFTSKEKNVTDKVASKNNKTKSIKLDLPLCLSKAIRVQCRQLFAFLSIISPNVVNLGSFG